MKNNDTHLLQNLHAISHSSNDAIVSADAQGRIVTWNPVAERIFLYGEKEVLGQPLHIIIPECFREAHDAGLRRVGSGAHRVIGKTVELAGLRRNGEEFPVELSN